MSLIPVANNGTASDCLHLEVNLQEKKFIYMLTLLHKRCPNKDFFHLPPGGAPSAANISENYLEKIEKALTGYSGAWGKLIHEKKT